MRASDSSRRAMGAAIRIHPGKKPRPPAGFVAVCCSVGGERFSSSLLLSVLLLYLNEHAGYPVSQATNLVGYFVGATYFMALVGGMLLDRVLGPWGAGSVGAALAAAGYGVLVARGTTALLAGLGLIVIGSGIYKASPPVLIDRMYGPDDAHRDTGFSLLYLVVNLGAFSGPVLGELWRTRYGFRGVFVLCGLGMLASHLSLFFAQRDLGVQKTGHEHPALLPPGQASSGALLMLCLTALLFAIAQLQTSGTLLLWARDHTERHLLGRQVPVSYFASVPALFIVLLSPAVARVFVRLRRQGREPGTATKLQLGMVITALAYVPLVVAALFHRGPRGASMLWLFTCLMGLAIGELLVSALGPSLITKRAPPHRRARWLSVWFGSIALGCLGAGKLGSLFCQLSPPQYFALMLLIPLAGARLSVMARH